MATVDMPRQNRVTPFGTLIATSARGTLMGNRGCLHDAHGQIRRPYRGTRWIACRLTYKGQRRELMAPGRYTELFFLDEATALAAGHRPCAGCRRSDFVHFRSLWAEANPALAGGTHPPASLMDACLHRERTSPTDRHVVAHTQLAELPDGVFVTQDGVTACLCVQGRLLTWSPTGYAPSADHVQGSCQIVTPSSLVRMLAAGYPANIHQSAFAD